MTNSTYLYLVALAWIMAINSYFLLDDGYNINYKYKCINKKYGMQFCNEK